MSAKCQVRISRQHFDELKGLLFPGDQDEHGAVLLAGTSWPNGRLTLHVREVHGTRDGVDYVEGKIGYRALNPTFIHRLITRARDENLAYLAVHNHETDRRVAFSDIDLQSHERGYPALLQISRGMPVGALVMGHRSIQADVWLPDGSRLELDEAVVVGTTIQRLRPSPRRVHSAHAAPMFDRQVRLFGDAGQDELSRCHVAILGLGGVGSLVAEYLARLGVGHFQLVDDDIVEASNLSRLVGASLSDVRAGRTKVAVAARHIRQANKKAKVQVITDDVARESVARQLTASDYLFLAADSMRARLVFNALVHQYLIPGVQLGSKIRSDPKGAVIDVMSANRPVRPGQGCLWCNQLIDSTALATESKSDAERQAQAYGVEEPNPSVIALNAVSAAHAVNDFMLDFLSLRPEPDVLRYEQFHFLKRIRSLVEPRRDAQCPECSQNGLRYARGDSTPLPCIEG
jgi:hypothetical protein